MANVVVSKKTPILVSTNNAGVVGTIVSTTGIEKPVKVISQKSISVSANGTAAIDSNNVITLKNNPVLETGVNRLDDLRDVDANGEIEGATLIYDSATDRYIVKRIDFTNITGNLDGGEF